ncbi:U3 snoRNA associated-domain-containing protein, partial [Aspergillus similis]
MLSQIVTAAKGILFPEENSYGNSTTATSEPNETLPASNSKMVTTRRSAAFQAVSPTEDAKMSGSTELSGKRKSDNATIARSPETQGNKRRKRSSIEATEDMVKTKEDIKQKAAPKKHFRFDNEEPVLLEMTESELPVDAQQEKRNDEEDSSEDEAPESVDNVTQLSKIKLEAKKREEARKIEEQAKREKRRQLDEARKQQAKASAKRKEVYTSQASPGAGTPAEDMLSESSATLQGSFTQDARRSTLPALLPDDILNAVPDVRPPTPPPVFEALSQKKPTKLRFLEKKEKAPKDVRMGDVAIRVLDSESSRKQPNTALAPKASRTGRGAREAWLKQARSTGHVNGMRMVSSGKRSFVR